jgi:DinB superfamily
MYTKDAIRFSLNLANRAMLGSLEQIQDEPLTFPTSQGGCHPLWVLGHLTLIEGLTYELISRRPNPVSKWAPLFAPNTTPVADASIYPAFGEIRDRYLELREKNLRLLDSLSEADLDTPTNNPPKGLEEIFATYGKSFLALAFHQTAHRGQITDAIRAAGRTVQLGVDVAAA